MTSRTKTIEVLDEYFKQKGRVLNAQEYAREADTPIRPQVVRRLFPSWPRMESIIMARREAPEAITDVDEVLRKQNEALVAEEKKWRDASENQHAKMVQEAKAQIVAEKLTANAATPQGANANKIAIGGPLPDEQPKLERSGATVNIDPETKERSVVDPEPEEFTAHPVDESEGVTPYQLRKQVEADTGNVETGDKTSGGSDGAASIETASALAGSSKTSGTASAQPKK